MQDRTTRFVLSYRSRAAIINRQVPKDLFFFFFFCLKRHVNRKVRRCKCKCRENEFRTRCLNVKQLHVYIGSHSAVSKQLVIIHQSNLISLIDLFCKMFFFFSRARVRFALHIYILRAYESVYIYIYAKEKEKFAITKPFTTEFPSLARACTVIVRKRVCMYVCMSQHGQFKKDYLYVYVCEKVSLEHIHVYMCVRSPKIVEIAIETYTYTASL